MHKIFSQYSQKFGVVPALQILQKLYINPVLEGCGVEILFLPNFMVPMYIRRGTSDRWVFNEVFVNEEYDLSFLGLNPKIIVDAGANIGLASIFFAHMYPKSRIFSVEPEESNFNMAVKNSLFYPNITVIKKALWNNSKELQIVDSGSEKWAFQVHEVAGITSSTTINGLTVDELMIESKINRIDILKIDIEGSEIELFESRYEKWLDNVSVIVIELHDRLRDGCSKSFYNAIKHYDFQILNHKGLVILVKKSRKLT
jgi:FkbM family methyltransferase